LALPAAFNWPVYLAGLLLMAAPVADVARQIASAPAAAGARPPLAAAGD
jgi:hypothetical protein